MKFLVFELVLCTAVVTIVNASLTSEEIQELSDLCCPHGKSHAVKATSCGVIGPPEDIEPEEMDTCVAAMKGCCQEQMKQKEFCAAGIKLAASKKCGAPETDIGKMCCEECSFGELTGATSGDCGSLLFSDDVSPDSALQSNAFHQCCLEATEKAKSTTEKPTTPKPTTPKPTTPKPTTPKPTTPKPTTPKPTTPKPTTPKPTTPKPTTPKPTTPKPTTPKPTTPIPVSTTKKEEKCQKDSCDHLCNADDGVVRCSCREGFRLQDDKKTCKDINECAEAIDDLCLGENTVCHNTKGSFKCLPIKKRDVSRSCPPGFKRNVLNQVCDDINECQLPRPPCPKYLCENTIGGYKCGGKPGKPFEEAAPGADPMAPEPSSTEAPRNDICPPGFRAGADDECIDIEECEERLDDCQRLSQHCINTHGGFFCQDHVSKRCAPGFVVNSATGVCQDIDECEDSEPCKRSEVCINLPGAYNCRSKISTLPKLSTKKCQEGTRLRPGGSACEDIDECREGTHLCDQFQNCINTFGAHECRCKNGFELDSSSGSCVDIDECALKLDNCSPGLHCVNALGSFSCSRQAATTSTTPAPPAYDYEYYDSEEENSTDEERRPEIPPPTRLPVPTSPPTTSTTTRKPTTPSIITARPTRRYPDIYHYYSTSSTTRRPQYTPPRPDYSNVRPGDSDGNEEEPPTRPTSPATTPRSEYPRPTATTRPQSNPRPVSPEEYPTSNSRGRPTYPGSQPDDSRRPEYTPSRPESTSRRPSTSRRTEAPPRRTEMPPTTPKASDNDIDSPFNPDEVHCLNGFEKDEQGNCVDVNECETGHHLCSNLEVCSNRRGGYSCECITGFVRDAEGWCAVITTPSTSSTTSTTPRITSTSTTSRPTTLRPTTPRPTTPRSTTPRLTPRPTTPRYTTPRSTTPRLTTPRLTTSRTTSATESNSVSSPEWPYTPTRSGPRYPPIICELGYTFDNALGKCVDIDECTTNTATCDVNEDCVNVEGGFRCVCGRRCRGEGEPTYEYTPSPPARPTAPTSPSGSSGPSSSSDSVITVGAQYGQRGPWSPRPTYSRTPDVGAIVTSCPWGYKLTPDKRCYDIDECAKNTSECGPMQKCENFYGGYSCQCPAGHRLVGQNGCEDIDECMHGNPCSYIAECVNTVGSYHCVCGEGFRNAVSNDKVCVDVDECADTPHVCEQGCSNVWGSYRCYCQRGYRLHSDNRTCVDVDECAEWAAARHRGHICGGECVNEPGSYRCACPAGYRLSHDERSCIDIDECETGEASCARSSDPGEVCQNTRGGFHCHRIQCPPGYRLEAKHRCTRIRRTCPVADWPCLQQPSAYSYNFITFVANIYLPSGSVDLFTMHGPSWREAVVSFEMRMVDVQASPGTKPAELRCFDMRPSGNICVVSLLCSLEGPQVAELELSMSLYTRGQFAGNAVARLIVIVSQYDF